MLEKSDFRVLRLGQASLKGKYRCSLRMVSVLGFREDWVPLLREWHSSGREVDSLSLYGKIISADRQQLLLALPNSHIY